MPADPEWTPEELDLAPEMPDTDSECESDDEGGVVGGAAAAAARGARAAPPAGPRRYVWRGRPLRRPAHPFTARTGQDLPRRRGLWTPLAVWMKFTGPSILQLIVRETNLYAAQLRRMDRPRFVRDDHPWPPRFLDKWQILDVPELRVFLGLSYGFGLVRLPRVRDYWSRSKFFYQFPSVRGCMSRNRFLAIKRCLHFVNIEDPLLDVLDPFYKVRPLLKSLLDKSRRWYHAGQNLALDEMMQCCHNRSCPRVVFRPPRKKTNGLKIWAICEAQTGYCCSFRVAYKGGPTISETVMTLVRDLSASFHRIHMDNLFTKPGLFQQMLEAKQYACGTWCANFGVPEALKPAANKALGKGAYKWLTAEPRLLGVAWRDSKVLNLLSSFHAQDDVGVVQRRESGHVGRVTIPAPTLAIDYNRNMGAVDEMDALRASYTTARPCRRWYLALFYWWLDMTAIQSMIVYRDLGIRITHADFVHELAVSLIAQGRGEDAVRLPEIRKRRRVALPHASGGRLRPGMHLAVKASCRQRCHRCSKKYGREKKTRITCATCQRHFCLACFEPYHREQGQ